MSKKTLILIVLCFVFSISVIPAQNKDGFGNLCDSKVVVLRDDGIHQCSALPTLLTASASLDFADPAANTCAAALTITLTGAAVGDPVILGIPSTITIQTSQFFPTPVVTATNTVTIKFCEGSTVTNNPAAGTFKVTVIK